MRRRLPVGRLRCLKPIRLRQSRWWNRLLQSQRAASPVREERRVREPVGAQKKEEAPGACGPGVPISFAPKYTDDDGDLRDTAATPKAASTHWDRVVLTLEL